MKNFILLMSTILILVSCQKGIKDPDLPKEEVSLAQQTGDDCKVLELKSPINYPSGRLSRMMTASPGCIFLDFDGQLITQQQLLYYNNPNDPFYMAPGSLSQAQKDSIIARVSEDFLPWLIYITTDSSFFLSFDQYRRTQVVFTSTEAPITTGSAGSAFLNSFTWGGAPAQCFVFLDNVPSGGMGYCANAGDVASHEIGHTLNFEHGRFESGGTCISSPSSGFGALSYSHLMNAAVQEKDISLFRISGPAGPGTNCAVLPDQHEYDSINLLCGYRTDVVGNTYNISHGMYKGTSQDHILETTSDVDFFRPLPLGGFPPQPVTGVTITSKGNLDLAADVYNWTTGAYFTTYENSGDKNAYVPWSQIGKWCIKVRPSTSNSNVPANSMLGGYNVTIN